MSTPVVVMNGLLDSEFFDVYSRAVGDTFRIFVAKPPFASDGRYPAIYVADGNTLFTQVMGIQRTLAWGAEAPAAYVVGIGYPTDAGFLPAIAKRNRDYAPTDGGQYASEVLRSREPAGAAAFLRFVNDELKPMLEQRYRIEPDDATFVGVSLGGLFGAWALLQNTATFQRYVLCSPAIWWNDEEIWQWETACAERTTDLRAMIFVSAGGLEFEAAMREHALHIAANNPWLKTQVEATVAWHDAHGWPRTTQLMQELADRLQKRRYASLRAHCHNMPDETHMSVAPAAICRGLRYVFDQWRPW
jgi:predicted alpha/beta superfamily hydrolase